MSKPCERLDEKQSTITEKKEVKTVNKDHRFFGKNLRAQATRKLAPNVTTKSSPFDQVLAFTPDLRINLARDPQQALENAAAEREAMLLAESLDAASDASEIAEDHITTQYNKKRKDMHFAIVSQVMVAAKSIRDATRKQEAS
ncbi:hypothetical protein LTR06_011449 [Exophiala xenobiotica]|nr:hypothetical protein LTR06_011449 [Exophiala xenobiotica]